MQPVTQAPLPGQIRAKFCEVQSGQQTAMRVLLFLLLIARQPWLPVGLLNPVHGVVRAFWTGPNASNVELAPADNDTRSNSTHQNHIHSQQPKDVIVTFVNGIYHSIHDVENISIYLKDTFNTDVRAFYNPTSGSWVMDAYKAGYGLVLRPSDLVLAKQLAFHLRNALGDVEKDGGRVLHIAHSGGAILTYLAAKYHLTSTETSRIDVITLGGGRSLTRKYFRGRVYNYYARNDPVLLVDNRASRLMRNAKNTTYAVVRDAKHNTTFIYLEGLARDPIFDHAMEGPTYRNALEWEAAQLHERLALRRRREARERDAIRRWRKRAAKYTGMHHFWQRYERIYVANSSLWQSGRKMRKVAANYTGMRGAISGKYRPQHCVNVTATVITGNGTDLVVAICRNNSATVVTNQSVVELSSGVQEYNTSRVKLSNAAAGVADLTRALRKSAAHVTGWRGVLSGKYRFAAQQNASAVPRAGVAQGVENEGQLRNATGPEQAGAENGTVVVETVTNASDVVNSANMSAVEPTEGTEPNSGWRLSFGTIAQSLPFGKADPHHNSSQAGAVKGLLGAIFPGSDPVTSVSVATPGNETTPSAPLNSGNYSQNNGTSSQSVVASVPLNVTESATDSGRGGEERGHEVPQEPKNDHHHQRQAFDVAAAGTNKTAAAGADKHAGEDASKD
jgi:hypothetical protein